MDAVHSAQFSHTARSSLQHSSTTGCFQGSNRMFPPDGMPCAGSMVFVSGGGS